MRDGARSVLILMTAMVASYQASASEFGDYLDRELKGGWGVLEVEVYSACGGTYSNNEVGAAGVASNAPHRFAAGELVKIDDVKVKKRRIDLLLTLAEPVRFAYMDGPFELYDSRSCRVQLMVFLPRELVKNRNLEAVLSEVRRRVTLYPSRDAAQLSERWNGRQIEPLPDDYEDTLQRHAVWKAEQTNAAVRRGIESALDGAASAVVDIDDDDDYLAGFSEGAENMTDFSLTNCHSLLNAAFTSYRRSAPTDQSTSYKDGWNDGQKLVFNVLLADRLRSCLVPVPLPPTP